MSLLPVVSTFALLFAPPDLHDSTCWGLIFRPLAFLPPVTGGTAANIIASRLSDADPDLTILIIEGGQNNYQNPAITHPALFLGALMPGSTTTLPYISNNEPALGNRQLTVPTGNVLGGGSSVNIMMYTRAQRSDWNAWKMPGWSAKEILPFLRKVCKFDCSPCLKTTGSCLN